MKEHESKAAHAGLGGKKEEHGKGKVREMSIKRVHGGYHVKHHMEHPDGSSSVEEHAVASKPDLEDHVAQNMPEPDQSAGAEAPAAPAAGGAAAPAPAAGM